MLSTFQHATPDALESVREEMRVRQTRECFLLFAMGSQFDHLIKQALERLGVFCLVADPASVTAEDVCALAPKGIILSGGPASVHAEPPPFDETIFDLGVPVLGICLGFQMWMRHVGLHVTPASHREFGRFTFARIPSREADTLLAGIPDSFDVIQSHGDVIELDQRVTVLGSTENAPVAAGCFRHFWGVQFHPEVRHTEFGDVLLENFCFTICGARDRFPASSIAERKVREIREQVGTDRVLLALSGGSDSSTVAYLFREAFRGQSCHARGVYIRGLDRPDDEACVRRDFGDKDWIELVVVDATDEFLAVLAGKTTMREKRVAMREVYKPVLEREAQVFGARYIAQGTLYTDISESGGGYASGARKAVIKIHHNTNLGFSLPELTPLADCVKDGGRNIGRALGVPEELLTRHPFPGPGLVVRIEGEVTRERLAVARAVDGIYIEELRKWGLYDDVWQAGAVVTQSVTTCTKGDDAASGIVIALWAVWSVDGFTAQRARLSDDFLDYVSRRITSEIHEVGAVVYRISDKPPATIEWG